GYQAASFPAVGDGGLREGCVRPVRRALVKEPALGAHLSAVEEIPRRGVPVVPRFRVDLRQLRAQLEDRRRERLSAAVREFCQKANPATAGFAFGAVELRDFALPGLLELLLQVVVRLRRSGGAPVLVRN